MSSSPAKTTEEKDESPPVCPVCEKNPASGRWVPPEWEAYPNGIPCCESCGTGEPPAAVVWVNKRLKLWRESGLAIQSSGDFLEDWKSIKDTIRSNARLRDGICPNGCARMVRLENSQTDAQCPRCGFVYHANFPITIIVV